MPKGICEANIRENYKRWQQEAALHAVKSGRPVREVSQAISNTETSVWLQLKTRCTTDSQLDRRATIGKEEAREAKSSNHRI
jgi:hypothetical protein